MCRWGGGSIAALGAELENLVKMSDKAAKCPPAPYAYVVWICCCILPPCIAFCCYNDAPCLDAATPFWAKVARACLEGLVVAYVIALPITSLYWLLLRKCIGWFSLALVAILAGCSPFLHMGDDSFSLLRAGILCAVALLARCVVRLAARVRRG